MPNQTEINSESSSPRSNPTDVKAKGLDPQEPVRHPNDKLDHNAEDLDLIMDNLRREASSLNIAGVDEMDRNELRNAIHRARADVTTVPNEMDPRENNLTH